MLKLLALIGSPTYSTVLFLASSGAVAPLNFLSYTYSVILALP